MQEVEGSTRGMLLCQASHTGIAGTALPGTMSGCSVALRWADCASDVPLNCCWLEGGWPGRADARALWLTEDTRELSAVRVETLCMRGDTLRVITHHQRELSAFLLTGMTLSAKAGLPRCTNSGHYASSSRSNGSKSEYSSLRHNTLSLYGGAGVAPCSDCSVALQPCSCWYCLWICAGGSPPGLVQWPGR